MIKVKYINDNNELIYVQNCKIVQEAIKVDYYIWKAIHKECLFEYKGYLISICQEDDFIDIEKFLMDCIETIDDLAKKCLEFSE